MRIGRFQTIRCKAIMIAASFAMFLTYPVKAFAIEGITLPVQMVGDDVVSISLPVISESETSVFDFILDPQELLYRTDAVRYGGGKVEEEATLLFHNKEGEYDFSKHSDRLTVTNRSTVPVQVTVTAQVTDFGDVRLAESADFEESTEPEVYLAIEDDKGNILPLSADGQTTINLEMSAAPDNTYVFRLDEENHTYQYGMGMDPDMVDFDTYSFGLVGACNPNAEWENISIQPTVIVTWQVEPVMPEEREEISEEIFVEEKNEGTTSDGMADESVSDNNNDNVNNDDKADGENNPDGSLDDENRSDNGSGGGNDTGNANGGLDDEDQSDNGSDDANGEDNASDSSDGEDQSDSGSGELISPN